MLLSIWIIRRLGRCINWMANTCMTLCSSCLFQEDFFLMQLSYRMPIGRSGYCMLKQNFGVHWTLSGPFFKPTKCIEHKNPLPDLPCFHQTLPCVAAFIVDLICLYLMNSVTLLLDIVGEVAYLNISFSLLTRGDYLCWVACCSWGSNFCYLWHHFDEIKDV